MRRIVLVLLIILISFSYVSALQMITKSYSVEDQMYIIRQYNDSPYIISFLKNVTTNSELRIYVINKKIFDDTAPVPKLLKDTNPIYSFNDIMNKLHVNKVLYLYVENKSNIYDRTYIMIIETSTNFISSNTTNENINNFFVFYIPNENIFISSNGINKINIKSLTINGKQYSSNFFTILNTISSDDTISINGNDVDIICANKPNTYVFYGYHIKGDIVYSGYFVLNPYFNYVPISESTFVNPYTNIQYVKNVSNNWKFYYLPSFNIFIKKIDTPIYTGEMYSYDVAPVVNTGNSIIAFIPRIVKNVKIYICNRDITRFVNIRIINNYEETIIVIKSKNKTKFIDVPILLVTEYGPYFLGVQSIYSANT